MSCADVCLSDADYEGNAFYAEKWVRARKPHPCVECLYPIGKGETYQLASGKNVGGMFIARTCAVCVDVRTAFCCGSWIFGELWERVSSELFPTWREAGPWDCLAKLTTPEAVARCTAEFNAWLSDNDYENPFAPGRP